jgi:hypothetical protein
LPSNQKTDETKLKQPTYYDDYYSPFVRYFVNNTLGFEHLSRPKKQWRPPKPSNIKYSKISKKRITYLESERRGNQGNVKNTESSLKTAKGHAGQEKQFGRQSLGGKTDGRHAKQLRTRKNPGKKAQG